MKKILSIIGTTLNIIILIAPFALAAYHIYSYMQSNELVIISLSGAFYDWLGIDIKFESFAQNMESTHDVYISLIRLPLILWAFVIAIPSFITIYRKL